MVLAIRQKSLASLKYLVELGTGKGLRETFQYRSEGWKVEEGIVYSNLALAVIAKIHDLEALNYLLKQTAFVLNANDILAFVKHSIQEKWVYGAKALLSSQTAHAAYANLQTFTSQRGFLEALLLQVMQT